MKIGTLIFFILLSQSTMSLLAENQKLSLNEQQKVVQALDLKKEQDLDTAISIWDQLSKIAETEGVDKAKVWSGMVEMLTKVRLSLKNIASDPNFQKSPTLNVSVDEMVVSGADPKGIKDPVVREKYEEAIRQNKALIKAANQKAKLRHFNTKIIEEAKMYFTRNGASIPGADKGFEKLTGISSQE